MDVLDNAFETFSLCAYRLEVLPKYSIYNTNEFFEYKKFIKGKTIESFANQDWLDSLSHWGKKGKSIERIRVIPKILTDYFKYEFLWCYPKNIEYGENIRFVLYDYFVSVCADNVLNDFWGFDKENVILLMYNDKFEYENCKQLPKKDVTLYTNVFEDLQQNSMKYDDCKKLLLL
ncbi:MAG: hypothetical protein LBP63_02315 [Prevotellaceae bacterium]|jgi:hypothetical protein|nr:hypothetical protein [Prevotellaceae bacterium]